MNKELEALKNIKREAGTPYFSTLYDIDMWHEDFATVENALKDKEKQDEILQIIKEKSVNVWWLGTCENINDYNFSRFSGVPLTQQEFDLLKEYF